MPIPRLTFPVLRFLGGAWTESSVHLCRLDIGRESGEWGGPYARNVEFPDFSVRYGAPGSVAGHRRGVRARAVESVLATQCAVLKSKADMQKRGQASPDDGDALALTFAQPVAPVEVEELDKDEILAAAMPAAAARGGCDDATQRVHISIGTVMVGVAWMVERAASGEIQCKWASFRRDGISSEWRICPTSVSPT